jgi:pimeloyl-ACP methyl ester carboxylesterase
MTQVVLVNGGWHGAWCWDGVTAELQARGVTVAAPELPLTSFADDIRVVRAALEAAGDDVVVCGHSYGGCVISAAATDVPTVRRLVYLCAFMVDAGEDPVALLFGDGTSRLLTAMHIDEDADTVTVDPGMCHDVFYADAPVSVIADLVARFRPMPFSDSWVHAGPPAWRTIPSTYVRCSRDRALPPALQSAMALHASDVVDWASDHSPWLTRPARVADLLASHAT